MNEALLQYKDEADADSNGRISIAEAFNYAEVHPHVGCSYGMDEFRYDDNGDQVPHDYPLPNGGDGAFGATVFLPAGPALDLDADDSSGVTGSGFAATFTEDLPPAPLADADALFVDPDGSLLTALTVTITNLQDALSEWLDADVTGTSIAKSYDPATGALSLTGLDTQAAYQQVLRTVTYENTSNDPDETARVITVVADDGPFQSNVATATVTVEAVDDTPPLVSSIARAGANPTGAATVDYTVTFTEPVTGVDQSDFSLAVGGGISGASIDGVSGSGDTYTVTVGTGSGDGTLRLDLVDDDSVVDLAGHPLAGAADGSFVGEVYDIDKVGTITGTKWNDLNADGGRDAGEPGLAEWTIFLDADADGVLDAGELFTTTDVNGEYAFEDLAYGTYTVAEVQQEGWTRTAPASGTYSVTITDGQVASGRDFGNRNLPPTVTLTAPAATPDPTPSVTVTATDVPPLADGTLVALDVDLNNDGDFLDPDEQGYTTSTLTSGSTTFDVSPALTDGTYGMRARVSDQAANEGTSSISIVVVDTTPPAVLSVDPQANTHTSATGSSVSVTYNEDVDPASASGETFVVHALQTGRLLNPPSTITTSGATVTLSPAATFRPTEAP